MQRPRGAIISLRRCLFLTQNLIRQRVGALAFSSTTGRAGDPEDFSKERSREAEPEPHGPHGNPQETEGHYQPGSEKREPEKNEEVSGYRASMEASPLHRSDQPLPSSPRLQNVGVPNPAEPTVQQKRRSSTVNLDDVVCAGLDGSPWPTGQERESDDTKEKRREEDNKEYFKHHKASPLSEIEMVDTRKPITRATDGTGGKYGMDVVGWLPEQLETAEETMERARRIWRENATRGDPDSPHGRVLRALRGEWF